MIAIDTNILVYSHREDMPQHEAALQAMNLLGASGQPWAIAWPCVHEFLAVVTGRAFKDFATPLTVALDALDTWVAHPHCHLIGEQKNHMSLLSGLTQRAYLSGAAVHDARIAAICIEHEVSELWTSDRDFQRFPDLRIRNPLIAALHEPIARYTTGS
jgi:uncharacterized protein